MSALNPRSILILSLMYCVMGAAQAAQPPTSEHVVRVAAARRQLQSRDPATVAWGAFDAANYRLIELAPELAALLEKTQPGGSFEQWAVALAVLDAVAQLDVPIPAEILRPYAARYPVQTSLALAKATGARNAVLLELLSSSQGYPWFAMANLLLEPCASGFAAQILSPLRFSLTITVVESGSNESGFGAGSGGGISIGDGIGQIPAGFPPLAWYRFEGLDGPPQRRGNIVLSSGPRSVYYSRVVKTTFQFGTSEISTPGPSDEDRLKYLQWMVDRYGRPLPVRRFEHIGWRDEADFVRQASALDHRVTFDYRFLLDGLVKAKCLSKEETGQLATPRVDVRVEDTRANRSSALPRLPR